MVSSIIAEGTLKTSGKPYEVKTLRMSDMEDMLALQEAVRQRMEDPETLQTLSLEEFEYILSNNGFMIGTYVADKMIAFRAMLVPPFDDPEHLGIDAGVADEELQHVIYSEITVVHPDFRGNRLQTYMGEIIFAQVDQSRYFYIAATVAPFNIPSMKDKLALGMKIISLGEKYDGKLRYVFFKNLTKEKKHPATETKWVAMNATARQQELMQKGFRGIAIERAHDRYQVVYER